jgi:hypothetical protein
MHYLVYLQEFGGSRDISVGIATGYRLGGRGSNPGIGKIFLFTAARPHTQRVPGAISPGVKRPGREVDYFI